mgnify:CR=1 FL=1
MNLSERAGHSRSVGDSMREYGRGIIGGLIEADDVTALATGLAHTGGVITSAAAIMVVVFAAFTLGEFLLMQMLGFALATAVFLDATIVRIAVGPAMLRLAGRWNWWPGERGRR